MKSVTVRKVPDEVNRALRVRAARHGQSTESEIRDILEDSVKPSECVKLGTLLTSIARDAGELTDIEGAEFEHLRDKSPARVVRLE